MAKISKPDLQKETPEKAESSLLKDISRLLKEHFSEYLASDEIIKAQALFGENASWMQIQVGGLKATHVFEFFIRDCKDSDLGGGLEHLIDFAEGSLSEFFKEDRNAFFPLDFTEYQFENWTVLAKHTMVNLEAEKLADELLKTRN